LTVLFCDLVGSTAVASRLGAEDWRDAVRRFQATAAGVIERYEGYVAQYLGDGLLVYFGYPQAHEDAPERAVRCGLGLLEALPQLNEELQAEHGISFAVRTGIHTGPVVIGEMGGGPRRETLALGDIPHVAARLQALAEPDTVVMSGATLRLVQGIFVTRDLGARVVKGLDAPLPVHQALRRSGMRSHLDDAVARELPALAGRDAELGLLMDRWGRACEGRGHAVAISGEPGIGKSRLVQAFRTRLAESAHTWLECRASAYTRDSALFPVLRLHQQLLGFEAEAPREEKLTRIEGGLETAGFDTAETVPIVAALHGLEPPEGIAAPTLSPSGLRKKTLELLAEWLFRLGRQQPLVLLVEDLQWMDPSTLDLLATVVDEMQRSQILLLLTYRPDFEPPWESHSHVTPLPLPPLGSAPLVNLIRTVARERALPDEWIREIARRSDGVPLFAEELTEAVLESSAAASARGREAEAFSVPESLEDLLMARLDQLGPAKEVAQLGAVIGREFPYSLLRALWPLGEPGLREALGQAVRRECLFQRGTPPAARYVFKHALIRDAAYQSLLRKTRRRYHEQVALALEAEAPETVHDQPELLAHHWTEAGEVERAIASWQRAGELAVRRAAHEEAIRHLTRALSLIDATPEDAGRDAKELAAQLTLGHALVSVRGWAHAETRAVWERARTLCDAESDTLRRGTISCGLGDSYASAADLPEALRQFDAARSLGETSGQELLVVAGHQGAAMVLHYQGRYLEALEHVQKALAVYDPKRHHFLASGFYEDKAINLLGWSAWIYWQVGYTDRAWAMASRAVEEARERRDPFGLAFALTWASITGLLRRDWPSVAALGGEAARVGEEQSFSMLEALGKMVEIFSGGLQSGDPETSARFVVPLGQASATGNLLGVSMILAFLAELQLSEGRPESAIATADGALAAARNTAQPCYDARLLQLKAESLRRLPDADDAEVEQLLRSAVETARVQHARSFELRAAASLAAFLRDRGRNDEAVRTLQPVYESFSEGFTTPDLTNARELLDSLG
jgi:class 3 adenylate cyclase/tetratricopeptide (TPR) repeat protein